jgi:RNA polymerase sigma-70 factor (ECF subfamily)
MIALYLALVDEEQKDKFEQVYYKYRNLLFYIAYEILQNERDAEDAVQEAFLRVAKNITKISDTYSNETKNFVVLITKREAMKIYNKRKKRDEDTDIKLEKVRVSEANMVNAVKFAIEKMPYKYSSLLTLKYVMGYSGKEIAEITGLSETNVRQQLFKGRKLLESMLEEE